MVYGYDPSVYGKEPVPDPSPEPRTGATVIRLRQGTLDHACFPALLCEYAGMNRADAGLVCAHGHGLLAENLAPEQAEALAAALRGAGEPCFVVPAAEVAPLPPPVPIRAARLTPTDLGPIDAHGRQEPAPWEKAIALVLAWASVEREIQEVRQEHGYASPPLGRPGSRGRTRGALVGGYSGTELKPEERLRLDLVFLHPLRRYRIDSHQFDYSLLGPAARLSGETNLPALARSFVLAAPRMMTTPPARQLAEPAAARLPHLAEHGFDETVHWLINLARFGKQAAG